MLEIIVHVDAPANEAQGIKEELAMQAERYGDARVVSVRELAGEQLTFGGKGQVGN